MGKVRLFDRAAAGRMECRDIGCFRGRSGGEVYGVDMKSVIIKDIDGRILFHIKDTKTGADAKVASDICPYVSILVIANDRSKIRLSEATAKRK